MTLRLGEYVCRNFFAPPRARRNSSEVGLFREIGQGAHHVVSRGLLAVRVSTRPTGRCLLLYNTPFLGLCKSYPSAMQITRRYLSSWSSFYRLQMLIYLAGGEV